MGKRNGAHSNFNWWKKDDADHLSLRGAKFLHGLSVEKPGLFVTPNILVREVMGYGHTPRMNSDEVEKMRTRYTAIRKILRKEFQQELLIEAGVGIRATTGSADVLVRALPKAVRKLTTAKNAVVEVDSLINMKDVPNTPELAPYRAMHHNQIKPLVRQLLSEEFQAQLKLPADLSSKK